MVQQAISLSALPDHYASFLSASSVADPLLLSTIVPKTLRDISGFTSEHRATLVEGIVSDLERWGAHESILQHATKLGQSNTYAVVTGQQAGIATGPLYTLYKAVGTIRAAAELHRKFPDYTFVPVFWIEGDDHDFDEARTISILERSGDIRTLRYDDGDTRRLHVGDRVIRQNAFQDFIADVRESLGETDFSAELFAKIEAAYAGSDSTLTDGFARSLYALAGDLPIVLISSRNPILKSLAKEVFVREAQQPEALFQALQSRTNELAEQNIPTPIAPKQGALFLTHQQERLSLDIEGHGYQLRGTSITMSRDETVALAIEHPERFSPNVALRPLVQDAILPTAIYLGGPSEVAYMGQLQEVYESFGMEQPAIAPRPFVTLVEPKASRALERSGIDSIQLFDQNFDPGQQLIDEALENELEEALNMARTLLEEGFEKMKPVTASIDQSLVKALGASSHKAGKELDNFGARLRSALKRKNETEINRLEGARALLLPGGALQERTLNPLYIANKYGPERLREVLGEIMLLPGKMQLISL